MTTFLGGWGQLSPDSHGHTTDQGIPFLSPTFEDVFGSVKVHHKYTHKSVAC